MLLGDVSQLLDASRCAVAEVDKKDDISRNGRHRLVVDGEHQPFEIPSR
jgi:hypothetical protein